MSHTRRNTREKVIVTHQQETSRRSSTRFWRSSHFSSFVVERQKNKQTTTNKTTHTRRFAKGDPKKKTRCPTIHNLQNGRGKVKEHSTDDSHTTSAHKRTH